MPRYKASIRRPDCSVGASAKEAAAFNAHSPGGTGCGLVQHVFYLPARIQLRSPTAGSQCAAPPSEKRCTLSRVNCLVLRRRSFGMGEVRPEPAARSEITDIRMSLYNS